MQHIIGDNSKNLVFGMQQQQFRKFWVCFLPNFLAFLKISAAVNILKFERAAEFLVPLQKYQLEFVEWLLGWVVLQTALEHVSLR